MSSVFMIPGNAVLRQKEVRISVIMSLKFAIIIIAFVLSGRLNGQEFLKAEGKKITNGHGDEVILRGIGLGGWMLQEPYMLQLSAVAGTQHDIRNKIEQVIGKERTAAFYNAWLANHCTKSDIDSLAAWGFNSVRLPMHYNLFTLPVQQEPVAGIDTWIDHGFALTDSLLNWCRSNKIYLILDLHAAPGGEGHDAAISDYDTSKPSLWESEANRSKMVRLWQKLAQRYKNEEWIGGYDILNEPNWGFSNPSDRNGCAEEQNTPVRQLSVDVVKAIRTVDKNHIIFIEGNCWGNNYKGILPFNYPNTVVSFHKYWNYNNKASITGILNVRDQYNMPVWLGESGENSNVWTTQAIKLLEDNHIGWAWWPLKKMGFNCPFEVKKNKAFDSLINYWLGNVKVINADNVYNGLIELANSLKTLNTTYHKDFLDAMFRQVKTTEVIPFGINEIGAETIISATDYDLGRNGYAYADNDTANYWVSDNKHVLYNQGQSYRNDGVDIKPGTNSRTNGFCVSWTEQGEWLQYTVNAKKKASYGLQLGYLSKDSSGMISIFVNDKPATPNLNLPKAVEATETISTNIYLEKGMNRIKIRVNVGGFDLNYIKFSRIKN